MAVLGLSRRKKTKKKTFESLKKKIRLRGEKIFALGEKKNENEQKKKNYWKQRPKKKWRVSDMKTNTLFNIIFLKIICSTFKSQTNSIVFKKIVFEK